MHARSKVADEDRGSRHRRALAAPVRVGFRGRTAQQGADKIKPPPQPDPGPEPVEPVEPVEPTPEVVDPPIDEITNTDWPVPGHFYVVQPGDKGYGIAKRALADAAFRAAKKYLDATDDQARTFASNFSGSSQHQRTYLGWITCESWNDATVTTHGYGDQTFASGLSGRAIRFLPQHADNLSRLRDGRRAVREMKFGTPNDRKNGVRRLGKAGGAFETLYLPGLSLKQIANNETLKLGGGKWPDGSSKAHPPKWVLDLGVRDRSKSVTTGNLLRGCGDKVKVEVVR